MGVLEELGSHLAASTSFTPGVNLFLHGLPDSPDVDSVPAIALEHGVGQPPQRVYGAPFPVHQRPTVDLIARTSTPANGATVARTTAAMELLHRAWTTLEAAHGSTLSGRRYLDIAAEMDPQPWGTDDRGRRLFRLVLTCTRTASTGAY